MNKPSPQLGKTIKLLKIIGSVLTVAGLAMACWGRVDHLLAIETIGAALLTLGFAKIISAEVLEWRSQGYQ